MRPFALINSLAKDCRKSSVKLGGQLRFRRQVESVRPMLPPVSSRAFNAAPLNSKSYATNVKTTEKVTTTTRRYRSLNSGATVTVNTQTYSYTSANLNAVRKSSLSKTKQVGAQHAKHKGKLTLVLDVDETLIHSRLSPGQDRFRQTEERKENTQGCEEFKITLEDGETIWVNKRPGLDKFLQSMSERYECIAYTAALEEYAKPLLDWLDPKGTIFAHRLYRDSCLFMRGYYVKDLQKVNRNLKRTVLVDNNAFCFLPQLSNGIPISSFYDDPNDNALYVLSTFLQRLDTEKDVRPMLNKSFNLQTLLKEHREHIIG